MGVSINFNSTVRRMGKMHASGLSVKHHNKTDKKEKTTAQKQEENKKQDQGVSVSISKAGQLKAEQLRKEKLEAIKAESREVHTNLERVNSMIARLEKEEDITDEEKAFLQDEMTKLSASNYIQKREHKITKDEYKYMLEESGELADNYQKRVDVLNGMQDQIEMEKTQAAQESVESMLAKAKLETEDKKRLVEILREIFEEEEGVDEITEEETGEDGTESEDIEETEDGEKEKPNTAEDNLRKRAVEQIKRNKELVDSVADDVQNSFAEVNVYNEKMDRAFLCMYNDLTSDERTLEEKVEVYQKGNYEMGDLFYNKMVNEAKVLFDAETLIMAKIEYNLHNDLDEVIKGGYDPMKRNKTLDMMLDFLTNNEFIVSETYDSEHPELIKQHMYEVWE